MKLKFIFFSFLAAFSSQVSAFANSAPFSIFESNKQFELPEKHPSDLPPQNINIYPPRTPSECEVALLTDGQLSLQARLKSLKNAKISIRIRALIFTADEAGLHIAEILKQKKKEGLKVVVMVDAFSNPSWKTQLMYYDLRSSGIEVEGFEVPWQFLVNEINPYKPLNLNKRFHDKLWIIDGEVSDATAVLGGLNIANEYFRIGGDQKRLWRDQDIAVRGEIIKDLVTSFDADYLYFKTIKSARPDILNTDITFKLWTRITRTILRFIGLRFEIPFYQNFLRKAEVDMLSEESKNLELTYRPTTARFIQSRPRFYETYIQQAYLDMIDAAKHEIVICNAYFLPREKTLEALKNAVRRGVNVTIMTNSAQTNDISQLSLVSRYLYKTLLEVNHEPNVRSKLKILEWHGDDLHGTLHAKFAVFDEIASIIGSYNLDPRSELLNSETVLALQNEEVSRELSNHFRTSDIKKAREVTFEEALRYHSPSSIPDSLMLELSLYIKDFL